MYVHTYLLYYCLPVNNSWNAKARYSTVFHMDWLDSISNTVHICFNATPLVLMYYRPGVVFFNLGVWVRFNWRYPLQKRTFNKNEVLFEITPINWNFTTQGCIFQLGVFGKVLKSTQSIWNILYIFNFHYIRCNTFFTALLCYYCLCCQLQCLHVINTKIIWNIHAIAKRVEGSAILKSKVRE